MRNGKLLIPPKCEDETAISQHIGGYADVHSMVLHNIKVPIEFLQSVVGHPIMRPTGLTGVIESDSEHIQKIHRFHWFNAGNIPPDE